MSEPEVTYEKALKAFEHREEYKYLLWCIEQERERYFGEVGKSPDSFTAGKWAGRIDATDWILELLTPEGWLKK